MTMWGLTIDCAHPAASAEFWALALGYERPGPPEEGDQAAFLRDPAGVGPTLSFLRVPESKVVKNRLHIDVKAGGGRQTPWEQRWPLVIEAVQRLTAAGATVIREDAMDGKPDHMVMTDPEGNEFCVV
jgi:hypothetical protein